MMMKEQQMIVNQIQKDKMDEKNKRKAYGIID
jgi:hypothetical protein